MSIKLSATSKPIRIMRETSHQMEQARDQYKERNFKYIGQVKDHYWIDGENKGKTTS